MKALLVITGMFAGLSAAQAAEGDDLVSAFKAACMGNEPFIEMVKNFAKSHGWHVEVRESKNPRVNGRIGLAIAAPPGQMYQGTLGPEEIFTLMIATNGIGDQAEAIDSCRVSQVKLGSIQPIADRVDSVLKMSAPSQPLSPEIKKYSLQDQLSPGAKQWSLSSTYTDYVILSEAQRPEQPTSLERIRAPLKEKP